MKGEGSVVQGERRGVAGAVCVALLWMGVWEATWGRERTPEHDRVFWESVRCTVAAEVEAYLGAFPEGRYERDARACLDEIAWSKVESCASEEGLEGYLKAFPEGKYEQEARACLGRVEEELGREGRMLVQRGLVALGEELVVDGLFGPRMRAAIVRWQIEKGYEGTGRLTQEQSEALKGLGRDVLKRDERLARERAERAEREREERARAEDEARKQAERERAERERLEAERKQAEAEAVGGRFRDCEECPELVVVPAGSYEMGSPSDDEGTVHRVSIGEALAVGVYEVTFEEWDACVRDGGCGGYRPNDWGWGRGRRPVIKVSWEDAQAYVEWLRGKTGKGYRLLSESEWEYVARAGTRTRYWWGDELGRGRANCDGCGSRWYKKTAPVGSFGGNGFGLHDVHGNVWEWVEDCWNWSYRGAPKDGSAWTSGNCGKRVLRGGSWDYGPRNLRSAFRFRITTGVRNIVAGFRIVRTL